MSRIFITKVAGKILLNVLIATSLTSCASLELIGGVVKAVGTVVDTVFPSRVPAGKKYRKAELEIGHFRLIAYVVQPKSSEDQQPLVICISSYWHGEDGAAAPRSVLFDANRISLKVSEMLAALPTGYAVVANCFGPLPPSTFGGIDLQRPVVTTRNDSSMLFPDVVLRFELPQPRDDEAISLDLGSIYLDNTENVAPRLELVLD